MGVGVQVECLGHGWDFGPSLFSTHCQPHSVSPSAVQCSRGLGTHSVRLSHVVTAGVEPQGRVAMSGTILLSVLYHALKHIGDCTVVAASIAGS